MQEGNQSMPRPCEKFVYLNVEQVELDGVSGVHILVRVEELPPQQQHFCLLHTLFPQRPAVVQPVH